MKRFIIICMAVLVIFTFTGCGKKYTAENYEEELLKEQKEHEEKAQKSFDDYEKVPDFACKDVKGNEVTQEVFSDYKLTMINIWSAYWAPCVEELAVLQKLHEELKTEKINIVGILQDYEETKDEVAKIIETSGITYTNIVPDKKFNRKFVNNAIANPTTLFIDEEGNLVGETIVGAIEKEKYEKAIKKALEEINK